MDKRKIEENIFKTLMILATFLIVVSLICILGTIFFKGFRSINLSMLIQTPESGYYIGKEGGILNAILGSLVLGVGATFLALTISIPVVLYLNFYLKKKSNFALGVRFLLDVLWGIPSIVYGVFGFTVMILLGLKASLLAGIITVGLLIIPVITRSLDEVLKKIPFELKEAALSLGATKLETAIIVVFRQALPGLTTAILIAFGRGIGDAAAVLFTAGFTDSIPYSIFKPIATLPLTIFFQLATPFPEVQERGYASAFVLIIIILLISMVSRVLSKRFEKNIVGK